MEKDTRLEKKARRYEEKGKYDKAIKLFEEIKDYKEIAKCYEKLQNWEKAAQMWERAENYLSAAADYEKADNIIKAFELYVRIGEEDSTQRLKLAYIEELKALPPSQRIAEKFKELGLFKEAAKIYESIGAFEPKPLWEYKTGGGVTSVAISADGSRVVAGSGDHKVYFFNSDGKLLWKYKTGNSVDGVAITADGSRIVAGSLDYKVYFFNSNGKLLWKYKTGDSVDGVAITADGSRIVAGSRDHKVYLFNSDGKLLWKYKTRTGDWVKSVAISADGSRIVGGGLVPGVYLFNSEGKLLWNYRTRDDSAGGVGITADGSRVVAGSSNFNVYLLNSDGELLWKHRTGYSDSPSLGGVCGVAITADGSRIVAGSRDHVAGSRNHKVYLFNSDGEPLLEYEAGTPVWDVGISADGSRIVAGSLDFGVYLFYFPFPQLIELYLLHLLESPEELKNEELIAHIKQILPKVDTKLTINTLLSENKDYATIFQICSRLDIGREVIDILVEENEYEEALQLLDNIPASQWNQEDHLAYLSISLKLQREDLLEEKLIEIGKKPDYKSILGGLAAEERLRVVDLLMKRGHNEEALKVLTSKPETKWGMKEQLSQLKLLVRLNLTDMAEKKLSQIKQKISVDKSPEFYYEFATFCEEAGKYRLALEVYSQFIADNIIYKDVLDRYRRLQKAIRSEGEETSGAKSHRAPMTLRETTTVGGEEASSLRAGKYELLRQIGSGGMGIVYEALNRKLGKKVAIKKMREEIRIRRRERERFLKEARTVAELHHPNIVDIYDIVEEEDEIYLVFEYVEGKTVERILDERPIGWEEAVRIIGDVCNALGFAHKNGVIHRDLKPSNIMVSGDGYVKVMDFGIAREAKETVSSVTGQRDTSGTLAYMPPEQHLGRCDIRGDIYALGVTFYEILTGQLPFRGVDLYEQKRQMAYTPPSELGIKQPKGVDEVIKKCLEAEKEKRYPSVNEFMEEVRRIQSRDT